MCKQGNYSMDTVTKSGTSTLTAGVFSAFLGSVFVFVVK